MKRIKQLINNIRILWHGLFHGLSKADKIITTQASSHDSLIEVIQQNVVNENVFSDMLKENVTQEVKETVDSYYRVFKKSNEFDTSSIRIIGEDENGLIFAPVERLKKKTIGDFIKHPPIFNPDNANIITIQDNFHLEDYHNTTETLFEYDTTLTVKRDNFIPRFKIDKLVKKMVVRECENNNVLVDLYLPSEASQFGKIDAIVIANIYRYMSNKIYTSDLTDLLEIEWVSNKAWNTEDLKHFKYKVNNLIGINKFSGSLVLTYFCNIIENGTDLTEKYKTKELDEKYAKNAPKKKIIDVFTLERNLKKEINENKEINLNNLTKNKIELN